MIKKILATLFFCTLFLFLTKSDPSLAKDKYNIAVLPFTVHSSENLDYIRQGIQDMLSSRLSYHDRLVLVDKEAISNVLNGRKDFSPADIQRIGKALDADYVAWGSITKIGTNLSLDGKLFDIAAGKSVLSNFYQCNNFDDVIPKLNEFAQNIISHILGSVPDFSGQTAPARQMEAGTGSNREEQIIKAVRSSPRGTLTSALNTEFINAPQTPGGKEGFWMSQKIPMRFRGMDIGDVNNDGLNEMVVISDHDIGIYQKQGNTLNLLKMIRGKSYNTYLSVDVADVTGNGIPNIIVTSLNRSYLNSFIMEYKDVKYDVIASNIPYFLRAITLPDSSVVLMGQPLGMTDPFDTPIYEMAWRGGRLRTGKKMMIPEGLSVYSVSIVNFTSSGSDKVLALDDSDRICVYEKTNKHLSTVNAFGGSKESLYRSEEVFGGTNNIFDLPDRQRSSNSIKDNYYINLRTFEIDADKEGKKQLIIVKNLSSTGRNFKNMTMFTAAEIYNLEWDGLGFVENWRTRKINGYVADYQIKDIDNDGQKELVLALVMSSSGFLQKEGVIVVYKLNQ